jgi:hypothetical protein
MLSQVNEGEDGLSPSVAMIVDHCFLDQSTSVPGRERGVPARRCQSLGYMRRRCRTVRTHGRCYMRRRCRTVRTHSRCYMWRRCRTVRAHGRCYMRRRCRTVRTHSRCYMWRRCRTVRAHGRCYMRWRRRAVKGDLYRYRLRGASGARKDYYNCECHRQQQSSLHNFHLLFS